ncbi:hypothetical protein MVEN_02003400 [Mycena venus]|uniref:Uncharacterized protein n=1 Tax=Mycena venus TaxID=2733690 RepID=A0A8H6XEJ0_9AGAR|nr:hypothetical protein MVEN_02003400 [Mycena venus]
MMRGHSFRHRCLAVSAATTVNLPLSTASSYCHSLRAHHISTFAALASNELVLTPIRNFSPLQTRLSPLSPQTMVRNLAKSRNPSSYYFLPSFRIRKCHFPPDTPDTETSSKGFKDTTEVNLWLVSNRRGIRKQCPLSPILGFHKHPALTSFFIHVLQYLRLRMEDVQTRDTQKRIEKKLLIFARGSDKHHTHSIVILCLNFRISPRPRIPFIFSLPRDTVLFWVFGLPEFISERLFPDAALNSPGQATDTRLCFLLRSRHQSCLRI